MVKKSLALFIIVCICIGLSSCVKRGFTPDTKEMESPQEYFATYMNGKKVGYSTESRTADPEKVITIINDWYEMNRLGTKIEVGSRTKHVERPNGEPIAFEYLETKNSQFWFFQNKKNIKIEGIKKKNAAFNINKTSNGKTKNLAVEGSDDLLLSEGWSLLIKETGLREGAVFTGREIQEYEPFVIFYEKGTIGKTRNTSLIDTTEPLTEIVIHANSKLYGDMAIYVYVDRDFHKKKAVYKYGGMTFEMISCSREFALSKNEKVNPTTENIIKCPVRIHNPGKAERITYYLIPTINSRLVIPASDNQSVRESGDGGLIVTVHPAEASTGSAYPYKGDNKEAREALQSTTLLQSDNQLIIKLARKAIGERKDAADAAKRIEAFVHGYLKPSNSSSIVSAVEVAEERKGDCSEYAVLTAALCRAIGIPARVVTGYLYLDTFNFKRHVFVPHAWTEAYIGDKWIGLDATRNRLFGLRNSYTAGHIALSGIGNKGDEIVSSNIGTFAIERVEQK